MGQIANLCIIKWVVLETEALFFTQFAWELWARISASRKPPHSICLENEFTECILPAITYIDT